MRIAPVNQIKARFSTFLKESKKGPIVVTKNGKPAGVLIGVTDEDEIERLLIAYSSRFQSILNNGREEIQRTGGIDHKDFWEDINS